MGIAAAETAKAVRKWKAAGQQEADSRSSSVSIIEKSGTPGAPPCIALNNVVTVHEDSKGGIMRTALTIAGSDSSGGAGIQADLKTMLAHHVYGMSCITALTAQNTTGVTGIMEVTPEFLGQQLDAVFTDIRPDAVKIGMVSGSDLIRMIAEKLRQYQPDWVVVDPVMVATSGARLISEDAVRTLKEELIPLATVITPNIPEAEALCGQSIASEEDMVLAGRKIAAEYGVSVLMKGGHRVNDANDLLIRRKKPSGPKDPEGTGNEKKTISKSDDKEEAFDEIWFRGVRIDNPNTHGTGCTLSSAIASNLALGLDLSDAVKHAKSYLTGALAAGLDLGQGSGPMDHGYLITEPTDELLYV